MSASKLNSLSMLKDRMDMNMEVYFSLGAKQYMLLPDPDTDVMDDGWLLVSNDHLLKKGTISEVLDYKIQGKPLKDQWRQATNIEM